MGLLEFEHHLEAPQGLGLLAASVHRGSAGGAVCGDLIDFRVELVDGAAVTVGFDAEGCGALTAAGSAVVTLVEGTDLLNAASVGVAAVCDELGGVSAAKLHAVELAVDAFHRALGSAARGAQLPEVKGRRLVAMSGGVDSSVAGMLVVAGGGEAIGVTLELWRDGGGDAAASCCSHVAVRRAREMAHRRGLPHLTVDLREEFRSGVVDPWVDGYRSGLTPNPCIRCNGSVRLAPMVDLAVALGAERLVTGHYARLASDADGLPLLREGLDPGKEQAYALCRVPREVLARMEFPLGELSKPEVRRLAGTHGLESADTPDSQDLCFLAGVGRDSFLRRFGGVDDEPGDVLDRDGRVIGRHRGIHRHTIGQRKGLGIGGGRPLFVVAIDADRNTITAAELGEGAIRTVLLEDVDLRLPAERVSSVRLRHHGQALVAGLERAERGWSLRLDRPVPPVAPGQIACFYDGDTVAGCATIAGTAA